MAEPLPFCWSEGLHRATSTRLLNPANFRSPGFIEYLNRNSFDHLYETQTISTGWADDQNTHGKTYVLVARIPTSLPQIYIGPQFQIPHLAPND